MRLKALGRTVLSAQYRQMPPASKRNRGTGPRSANLPPVFRIPIELLRPEYIGLSRPVGVCPRVAQSKLSIGTVAAISFQPIPREQSDGDLSSRSIWNRPSGRENGRWTDLQILIEGRPVCDSSTFGRFLGRKRGDHGRPIPTLKTPA